MSRIRRDLSGPLRLPLLHSHFTNKETARRGLVSFLRRDHWQRQGSTRKPDSRIPVSSGLCPSARLPFLLLVSSLTFFRPHRSWCGPKSSGSPQPQGWWHLTFVSVSKSLSHMLTWLLTVLPNVRVPPLPLLLPQPFSVCCFVLTIRKCNAPLFVVYLLLFISALGIQLHKPRASYLSPSFPEQNLVKWKCPVSNY